MSKKELDLATVTADVVNEAVFDFKNSKHFKNKIEVQALFNMYTQPIHIAVLEDSPVKDVPDLKGKRVVVGSPGSGTEVKTRAHAERPGAGVQPRFQARVPLLCGRLRRAAG